MDVKVAISYEEGFSMIIKDVESVQDAERIALESCNEAAGVDMSDLSIHRSKVMMDGRDPWMDTVHRDLFVADSEKVVKL